MRGGRPAVLVVDDDPHLAEQVRWALKDSYAVTLAGGREAAIRALKRVRPDLVLADLCLPPSGSPEEGFRILRAAQDQGSDAMVVIMSGVEDRESALRAVGEGAYDFFHKPVDIGTLRVVVRRALERQSLLRENRALRRQLRGRFQVDGLVGLSRAMQDVCEAIERVKDSPVSVILQGESGTGKEMVARAIHFTGVRREGPFVPVHCAALPESLLETELFGHERGAFTGATGIRVGRFEAADGGTLFLDEISCLTPATQAKLLRILEDRAVERLGSNKRRPVDIRLITATNEDLEAKVRRGEFREDLYFRIRVFPIRIPPLRERVEDIPLLADHFLKRIQDERGGFARRLSPELHQALTKRAWPGNVRELQNVVETLAVLADGETIQVDSLPGVTSRPLDLPGMERAHSVGFKQAVDEFEKKILVEAIRRAEGVKRRAAASLGLDPSQMKYLVRKHGL